MVRAPTELQQNTPARAVLPLLFHGTGGQLGNSGQDAHELFAGDGFFLIQVLGNLVQLAAVFNQHLFGFFMLLLDA